jgi:hypothetical protein
MRFPALLHTHPERRTELPAEESGRLMHGCMLGSQPLQSDAMRLARQFACLPRGCHEARPLCAVHMLHDRVGTA